MLNENGVFGKLLVERCPYTYVSLDVSTLPDVKNILFTDSRILITGDHSKLDQILFVKTTKYKGFCVYRRSYLLWSPVIGPVAFVGGDVSSLLRAGHSNQDLTYAQKPIYSTTFTKHSGL